MAGNNTACCYDFSQETDDLCNLPTGLQGSPDEDVVLQVRTQESTRDIFKGKRKFIPACMQPVHSEIEKSPTRQVASFDYTVHQSTSNPSILSPEWIGQQGPAYLGDLQGTESQPIQVDYQFLPLLIMSQSIQLTQQWGKT